jgi:hypothetical protein
MDLTLVVLAAGLSTRYGSPKQLEPVGPSGEALLDYGIYDALRAGFSKVVIVTRRELEDAFREHLRHVFGDGLTFGFAYQELGALPEGYTLPERRKKPWGTAHAVLAAEVAVGERFVAINADDFYGAETYGLLAQHLQNIAGAQDVEFAAAGYRLRDTLSPFGGVSRAVCEVDSDGYLERVTEVKRIKEEKGVLAGFTLAGERYVLTGDETISKGALAGFTLAGERYVLTGDETISMNIWAATPTAFPMLHRQFARFLNENGTDVDAEFLLSTAVNHLIALGDARVRVIASRGPWLGMTYQEDRPYLMERLGELVRAGRYPADLAASLPTG